MLPHKICMNEQVLKAVVAKYNAEELLSKRESVSNRIREELIARAQQFHLIMDDVSITHLTFGQEFTKAIENKQVYPQNRVSWRVTRRMT